MKNAGVIGGGNDQNVLMGFQADDDDERDNRGGRGGRGQNDQRGGRRQNAKAALKKTEEDFPTL